MPAEQKETTEAARSAARAEGEARPRSGLLLMREESRRWESGKPAFGFPLFHPPSSSELLGMWESRRLLARFPRGSWKEWEAGFWLSTLSTGPAFPQLFFCCRRADGGRSRPSAWKRGMLHQPPEPGGRLWGFLARYFMLQSLERRYQALPSFFVLLFLSR